MKSEIVEITMKSLLHFNLCVFGCNSIETGTVRNVERFAKQVIRNEYRD